MPKETWNGRSTRGIIVLVEIVLGFTYHKYMFDVRVVVRRKSIQSLIKNPSAHLV